MRFLGNVAFIATARAFLREIKPGGSGDSEAVAAASFAD
jgi:hypothetical protein